MNQSNTGVTPSHTQGKSTILTHWLNVRRKRFWAIFLLLGYTLLGFFAAPWLVQKLAVERLQEDLGRTARIQHVEVNPFVLSLRVEGFELDDKDGVLLASFDELFVNFQLSSLFNRAWTFAEIRLLAPYFLAERLGPEDSRPGQLAADIAALGSEEPAEDVGGDAESPLPRLLIHDLAIAGGRIDLEDRVPETPVGTLLSPVDISIQSLNTLPDRHGRQTVTIQLTDNASLTWSGSLTLAPLDSQGQMVLKGLHLDPAIAYLRAVMPLDSLAATLSMQLEYHVSMGVGDSLKVDVSDMQVSLDDVSVSGLAPGNEFFKLDNLSLTGGEFQYPAKSLSFTGLSIDQPHLVTSLKQDGNPDLLDLNPVNPESGPATTPDPGNDQDDWQLAIEHIELAGGSLAFSDPRVEPAAKLEISDLAGSLSGFNLLDDTAMELLVRGGILPGGTFDVEGKVSLFPDLLIDTHISTRDLLLRLGQPYARQYAHIELKDGLLNSDMDLALGGQQNLVVTGSANIPSLDVINTLDEGRLIGWQLLDIDKFEVDLGANSARISNLTFEKAFVSLLMDENQVTNIENILVEQQDSQGGDASSPLRLSIGRVVVSDSSMDFSDLSLPLPFATRIIGLDGSISTIDSVSETPANIQLEGQVDEYGLARIDGSMDLLNPLRHTDMGLEFRNLLMSNLSPYTVQFAGREIDEGKLDLDLGYRIDQGQLNGSNKIILSDLVLGQKVEHPDAASLPLGLAVSLLKDADGVINLDLPVEGDVNDPEFRIGGVVWQAIRSLIVKVASAPFRLLGSLIGVDSEELGQFEFLAGRADLTPPELEKIMQLEQALQQRPELAIEISGVMDPVTDTDALKKLKLIEQARQRLGVDVSPADDTSMMLDEKIRAVVENMFGERFPEVNREDIRASHVAPPADDPDARPVLDELAYATDLWNRLLEAETVSGEELAELANARARVIRDAFLADGAVTADRVLISEVQTVESADGEWVVLELAVAAR